MESVKAARIIRSQILATAKLFEGYRERIGEKMALQISAQACPSVIGT